MLAKVIGIVSSVYLGALSLVVFVNWILTPIYHDGSTDYPIWEVINWFSVVAVVLCFVLSIRRKVELDKDSDEGITRRYLEVNIVYYASILLAMWYLWNWFGVLWPERESTLVGEIHLAMWAFVNPLFVMVTSASSSAIWRRVMQG